MSQLKVISWNVNGLRARIDHVKRLLDELKPDVLCMQETKVANDLFPASDFTDLGYTHQLIHGRKSHHGVAIVSRVPFVDSEQTVFADKDDCRHVAAQVSLGATKLWVHNFYVPSGGDEPDPAVNDKFDQKLRFWADMATHFAPRTTQPALLVGDLNVAPAETDVWDHKRMRKMVGHSPVEVEALTHAMDAGSWTDLVRQTTPVEEHLYSWWTYRSPTAFERDRGWRLDHAWATQPLLGHVKETRIWRDSRSWTKPSDHAPVVVELTA